MTMMGVVTLRPPERIFLVSSMPLGAGILTSRKMASNFSRARQVTAWPLCVRARESMSTEPRTSLISSQFAGSSSTISARVVIAYLPENAGEPSAARDSSARLRFRGLTKPATEMFAKLPKIDGFRDAGAAAGAHHTLVIGEHGVRGDGNHRERAKVRLAADPSSQRKPVLRAQLDVEQHGFGRLAFESGERFVQRGCGLHLKIFRLEPVDQELQVRGIIFDDENSTFHDFVTNSGGTTCFSCWKRTSCQRPDLRSSAALLDSRYSFSAGVRSLLVRTKTASSAVDGFDRHSASRSKPLTSGRIRSRITRPGSPRAIRLRAAAPSAAISTR